MTACKLKMLLLSNSPEVNSKKFFVELHSGTASQLHTPMHICFTDFKRTAIFGALRNWIGAENALALLLLLSIPRIALWSQSTTKGQCW